MPIWTKNEYAVFTGIISKPDAKRTVYLKLANLEENNEGEEEDFSAKQLRANWQGVYVGGVT